MGASLLGEFRISRQRGGFQNLPETPTAPLMFEEPS
jgi:hypothetical protein